MTRSAWHASARPRSPTDRASLYEDITNRIIAELEAGRLPWVQPWGSAGVTAPLGIPRNAATGRNYSGINVLILWGAVVQHGYPAQSWLTFRQAVGLGGNVRKGERGTTVVYADRFVPDDERQRAHDEGEAPRVIPFLKRFTVFNVEQCEGLPEDVAANAPPVASHLILPQVEELIRATGADIRIGGDKAYYDVAGDFIRVPPPQVFFEPINWHRSATHEPFTGAARVTASSATSLGRLAQSHISGKSWWPRSVAEWFVPHSASCRPYGMPTISAPGLTCWKKTIARLCAPHPRRRKPQTTCWRSYQMLRAQGARAREIGSKRDDRTSIIGRATRGTRWIERKRAEGKV